MRCIGLLLLALTLSSLLFVKESQAQAAANPTPLVIEQSILSNMKQNGFDNSSSINGGLGGLWINWRYGTKPLQTNFNGSGKPDGSKVKPPRHDNFDDLRYLHALWLYKSQNPTDTQYNSEITKYTPIVKHEFASTNDLRGWIFDQQLMDLYQLSGDVFFKNTAMGLAASYAKAINPKVGIIYQTNSAHPHGFYRPADAVEEGCALIQAGTLFNQPQWVQLGQGMINFLYSHAYITQYHAFSDELDNVLLSNGKVNPTETFYTDSSGKYTVSGDYMKIGNTAQIIISLLHTYQDTKNTDFLNKASDLLNSLSLPANPLGMWDTTYLGYYFQLQFSGKGPQQPGTFTIDTQEKEAGRQVEMLWAFHLANQLTKNQYANMETLMQTVALTKAYYASGHGVLDSDVNRQWVPITINGQSANWVTAESMGIELESLFDQSRTTVY